MRATRMRGSTRQPHADDGPRQDLIRNQAGHYTKTDKLMPPRRIAVVSSSRADYSHLYWPLKAMDAHPELTPELILFGAHLSPEFGRTGHCAEDDGWPIVARVESLLSSDSDIGMAKSIGVATLGLADALGRCRPDLLLIIADRYEMLAAASVACTLRIPIGHIEGGEVSLGAIDDAVRNALTKLSHLHFTPHQEASRRVYAMGEEGWRIHTVGAPSLDHLRHAREQGLEQPAQAPTVPPGGEPLVVVAFHPLTLAEDTLVEVDAFFAGLDRVEARYVFCFPNPDAGSRALMERARGFCAARSNAVLHVNLPAPQYMGLLACADAMTGNSSSGIMESPSFELPAVNVGERQRGRLSARNVIPAPAESAAVAAALQRALDPDFRRALAGMESPYGDGRAGERIAEALAAAPGRDVLLAKPAVPLGPEPSL